MRTTLKDIAERVGVTKALVSLYLNNHPLSAKIAKSTKEKIDRAVKELNYHPSTTARALKSGRSRTLGLVIGDICSNYFGFLAQSLLNECAKYDYQLLIGITRFDPAEERRCLENLINRQTDGIFYGMGVFPGEYLLSSGWKEYPILQLHSLHPDFNAIGRDEKEALKTALRCVREQGARRIVVAGYGSWLGIIRKELESEEGMEVIHVPLDFFSTEEDFDRIRELAPDAVFCSSSTFVVSILERYSGKSGTTLPRFIYSYTLPCDCIDEPCITGVIVPDFKNTIRTSVLRMIRMLEKPENEVKHLKTPVQYLEREQMLKCCEQQLADPFYEPFSMKLKYKQKGIHHE